MVVHVARLGDGMHIIFLSENLRERDNLSTGMRMSVWYSGRLLCEQQWMFGFHKLQGIC